MTAATYTAYSLSIDGALSNKEHLNSIDEVNDWMSRVYGRFATILIVRDQTGATRKFTDSGEWWDAI